MAEDYDKELHGTEPDEGSTPDSQANPAAEQENSAQSKIVKKSDSASIVYRKPKTDSLCTRCEKYHKAAGSDYCEECAEILKKKKIPVPAWLAAIVSMLLAVFSLALVYLNFAPAKRVVEAVQADKNHCLSDAYNAYEDAFSVAQKLNTELGFELVHVGSEIQIREMNVVARQRGPFYAGNIISSSFDSKTIESNPQLRQYVEEYQRYAKAYELVGEYVGACESGTASAEETLESLKALEAGNQDLLLWIIYYESYVDVVYGTSDNAGQLEYVNRIKELYPDASWYFNSLYVDIYYGMEDYESCEKYCDASIENNRNSSNAYLTKLKIAMLRDDEAGAKEILADFKKYNPDNKDAAAMETMLLRRFGRVEEAIVLCDSASEETGSTELIRQQALNYLVCGDYDAAYDSIYNAYTTAYNYYSYGYTEVMTSELIETTYLCATMCKLYGNGTAESYADLDSLLSNYEGYEAESGKKTQAILAGEMTAEEALTEGSGDII